MTVNRRNFLSSTLMGAAVLSSPLPLFGARSGQAAESQASKIIRVVSRTIEVNRTAAKVFGLQQPDGVNGLTLVEGVLFDIDLKNELTDPTTIHWHGLTPPWASDGVGGAPLPLLESGASRRFSFPVGAAGTHWMHAHTLQEQNLLAAPLIVRRKNEASFDEQEVVILLHDFSFTPAAEILAKLQNSTAPSATGHAGMHGSGAMTGMKGMQGMAGMAKMPSGTMPTMDLNDIEYDAYLANDRTLDDPEVVKVERGGRVRLRIINGATATAFWIDLGALTGSVQAVDGQDVQPFNASRVPLSMGQRVDIVLKIPDNGDAVPVLALREGTPDRTGIILAPAGAQIKKMLPKASKPSEAFTLDFEKSLRSTAREQLGNIDRRFSVDLTGDMSGYRWGMQADRSLLVRAGDTVSVTLRNTSMMSHPMHLHGHHFKVLALDGIAVDGAVRDTLLLPPMASATIAFVAANPGKWAFHCHHLYHMASGMMSTLAYENVG